MAFRYLDLPTQHKDLQAIDALHKLLDQGLVAIDGDCIGHANDAALAILHKRPDVVKKLAYDRIHAFKPDDIPPGWLRLFEEASLYTVKRVLDDYEVRLIHAVDESFGRPTCPMKRPQHRVFTDGIEPHQPYHCQDPFSLNTVSMWVKETAEILDSIILVTGAPLRRRLVEDIFRALQGYLDKSVHMTRISQLPDHFPSQNKLCECTNSIDVIAMGFSEFQLHLDRDATPFITRDIVSHWPAFQFWKSPRYLFQRTLCGLRQVPVELGRSYTDKDWTQEYMSFKDFMLKHLLDPNSSRIGYLAQHDFLAQIPALAKDTITPDLCYAAPPETVPPNVYPQPKALDEPVRNSWLGPAGTISPLHTDPYHNFLCQVVGRKYIRLYPPNETEKLYPRGVTDTGISMHNTSNVDIGDLRRLESGIRVTPIQRSTRLVEFEQRWPQFKLAQYKECILEAGDALYIPVGWWHYVESLEVSFNVSYWFN